MPKYAINNMQMNANICRNIQKEIRTNMYEICTKHPNKYAKICSRKYAIICTCMHNQ